MSDRDGETQSTNAPSIEAMISTARDALSAGTFAQEEARLRQALAASPEDADLYLALGIALEQAGRLPESALALQQSVNLAEAKSTLTILARVQANAHDYAGLERTLLRLTKLLPSRVDILLKLAKTKSILGDAAGALLVLKWGREIDPENVDIVLAITQFADGEDESTAENDLRAYIRGVIDKPRLASPALEHLLYFRNRHARRLAGLPPNHAVSWLDTCRQLDSDTLAEFRKSIERELQLPRVRSDAVIQIGSVAIADMDWEEADRHFKRLRRLNKDHVATVTALDAATWKSIDAFSDADIFNGLPEVVTVHEGCWDNPSTLFLASDVRYFERFTIPLLESLYKFSAAIGVHVHLLNGTSQQWTKMAGMATAAGGSTVTVTAEDSAALTFDANAAKNYWHAIRFVRLYQRLLRAQKSAWLMDVDATILKDPTPALSAITDYDLAIMGHANALFPWNKIAACLVGASPTSAGIGYLKLVSAYIVDAMRQNKLRWGIDQMALFGAYSYMHRLGREPRTWFLGDHILSLNGNSGDPVMDFVSGAAKWQASA